VTTGRPKRFRRIVARVILALAVLFAVFFGRPAFLIVRAWVNDRPAPEPAEPGFADDVSRLNRTPVREVWSAPPDPAEAERQLAELIRRARRDHLKVSIAGARHSMGGHTIAPDGVVVNMLPFDRMELDAGARALRVGAGARWSQVVPYLDARGFSVAVMQSSNDFSVGGSLSVNCHGWQHDRPPVSSTVVSFRLMKADGEVVRCSRNENAELFSLALGGYGLFGIILDAELRVVPNVRYRAEAEVLPADRYVERFRERVGGVGMVYGRLCVAPGEDFLREAIMTVFRDSPCAPADIPPLRSGPYPGLRRAVYRAQIGSESGKAWRWRAERRLGEELGERLVSRNQLLNEATGVYREQNADRTEVVQEYFLPYDRFAEFLGRAREIIPRHPRADLLNVTVRNILEDRDTLLRYADRDVFAFVMVFNQERTAEADGEDEALTRELIDASLSCGGRYYLPYRLHATREQFLRAYPRAGEFFRKKRACDPDEVFWNQFYGRYGRAGD
jgi:FAD/FMN-containing dehydrogenase